MISWLPYSDSPNFYVGPPFSQALISHFYIWQLQCFLIFNIYKINFFCSQKHFFPIFLIPLSDIHFPLSFIILILHWFSCLLHIKHFLSPLYNSSCIQSRVFLLLLVEDLLHWVFQIWLPYIHALISPSTLTPSYHCFTEFLSLTCSRYLELTNR